MTKTPKQSEELSDAAIGDATGGHSGLATGKRVHKPLPVSNARGTSRDTGFDASADLKAKGFNPQPEPPAVNLKLKR